MTDSIMYHDGNRRLQDRFDSRRISDRLEEKLTRVEFTSDDKAFIESVPYFFLATADFRSHTPASEYYSSPCTANRSACASMRGDVSPCTARSPQRATCCLSRREDFADFKNYVHPRTHLQADGARIVGNAAIGPSRHFAATQQFGRFRSEADAGR